MVNPHRVPLGLDDLFGLIVRQSVFATLEQVGEHAGGCLLLDGPGKYNVTGQAHPPGNVVAQA